MSEERTKLIPSAGSARLSEKQRDFLKTIAELPEYMPGRPACLYWGNIPERIWFTFCTETAVRKWVENLAIRGMIRIEKDFFYYITDKGLSAIGQNVESSNAAENQQPK